MTTHGNSWALTDLLRQAGIPEACDLFAPHWESSLACYPPQGPYFLDEKELEACLSYGVFPEKYLESLKKLAAIIRGNPAWRMLIWHLYRLILIETEYPQSMMAQWPCPEKFFGNRAGLVYLLPFLGCVRMIREWHRQAGIPEEITRATCPNVANSIATFEQTHGGRPGINTRNMYWLRNHVAGKIFRLGRLEYRVEGFPSTVHVFREKKSGRILALLSDGCGYNEDGLMYRPAKNGDYDHTARLTQADGMLHGIPVHPSGRVWTGYETSWPANAWQCILAPGDPVLEIHIPKGKGMTLAALRDSMRMALSFFPQYCPARRFVALASRSWMFNPELEEMLPAESNLIQFQRQTYLYPTPTDGKAGLQFLFDKTDPDPETAPRETRLQRAMLQKLRTGGGSLLGGMFVFPEHVDHFGQEYYRNQKLDDLLGCPGADTSGA